MDLNFENADSKEEVHFSWWLDDLMKAGYVDDWTYQPQTFDLSPPIAYTVRKELKTKTKMIQKSLLQAHTYTPDFWIMWSPKAHYLFYQNIDDNNDLKKCLAIAQNHESFIDVKPVVFGRGNSFFEVFKNNQKWVWMEHGIYVQPLVVYKQKTAVFESTFCPERFRTQDKMKGKRKINFKAINLGQYLETIKCQ